MKKYILLIFGICASSSCVVSTPLSIDEAFSPGVEINLPAIAPVTTDLTPANFDQDTQSLITLSYSDANGDQATSCSVTAPTNVTITSACSCTAGVCTVGVTGTPLYYSGAGSFNFSVTAGGMTSNISAANFTINKTAFTSVWRTTGAAENVTLPLRPTYTYNAVVDWGDGTATSTISSSADANRIHNYALAGDYTITINGTFESIYFNNAGDKLKIISISNLGKVGWKNFNNAFYGCTNLTTVSGGDTSAVTDMSGMFHTATLATPDTSGWDTSNVLNMASMFFGAAAANPDVSGFNTGSVTDMSRMFFNATSATPNTTNWNVSSVQNMLGLFSGASLANPDVSGWVTTSANNMSYLFQNAVSATPDTSGWTTSIVTTMNSMFAGATLANPNTSSWNTILVLDMMNMFLNATSANPDTSLWNVSAVQNFSGMFYGATSATPNTTNWNTAAATNMSSMFSGATLANPVTTNWTVTNVTNMNNMFLNATSANPDTSLWNVSAVQNFSGMFYGATSATPNTTNWNTAAATNMASMFLGATLANPDPTNWSVPLVTSMTNMFLNSALSQANYTTFLNICDATTTKNNVPLGAGTIKYLAGAVAARGNLTGVRTWTITDGGLGP